MKDILLAQNALRETLRSDCYDPIIGIGTSGRRIEVTTPMHALAPEAMTRDKDFSKNMELTAFERLRCRYDFEFWCARCVRIKQKRTNAIGPFILNPPQRRCLQLLEADRIARLPMRLIILKARQWGGSTLVQMYMAWIQTCLLENCHSVICAHRKDVSATIRAMFSKLLREYPSELWLGSEKPSLKPFEGTSGTRTLAGRDCNITIGSSENPDSVRGADYTMAHLSETAFWRETHTRSPRDVIQAICGSIALEPNTLVAIESTAKGVGDFFHSEWLRNKSGKGDKHAIFVPWYEIDIYATACNDPENIINTLTTYEQNLWRHGCTCRQIAWRRMKRREFETDEQFNNEFPGSDLEAFLDTDDTVFSAAKVEALRKDCCAPVAKGEIENSGFIPDTTGCLEMWKDVDPEGSYVVSVDVGGRSAKADWSVIAVLRKDSSIAEVVAQWRGHIDHDLLADKAVLIARYYNTAKLVIESNTYETSFYGGGGEDANLFILNRIAREYSNVYRRELLDSNKKKTGERVGFHTNSHTKKALISTLIKAVREKSYIERDSRACNELLTYRQLQNGGYAAREGCHDDILMTRAIALFVIDQKKVVVDAGDFEQKNQWP